MYVMEPSAIRGRAGHWGTTVDRKRVDVYEHYFDVKINLPINKYIQIETTMSSGYVHY